MRFPLNLQTSPTGDLRLQIGERSRRLVTAQVVLMFGLAGLVFTVSKAA